MYTDPAPMLELPAPQSSRLIDFERVKIITLESFPPQLVLVVAGTKPYLNMEVTLQPLVYIRQPEYWGIEVVGTLPGGIGLPATAPYQVSLALGGNIGTAGIEVIGATRSERRDIDDGHEVDPPSAELLFSRDDRPADGELREIRIVPDDGATFAATLHTAIFNQMNGGEVERTEELASGLTCTITDTLVTCSRDDRPVDGQLKELVVARNSEGLFDATLRTAFFDRVNGGEVDETAEIGAGLTRQ